MKKARRKGRPASAKEDLLKMKIDGLEKEWQNGFCKYEAQYLSSSPAYLTYSCSASRPRHGGECRTIRSVGGILVLPDNPKMGQGIFQGIGTAIHVSSAGRSLKEAVRSGTVNDNRGYPPRTFSQHCVELPVCVRFILLSSSGIDGPTHLA